MWHLGIIYLLPFNYHGRFGRLSALGWLSQPGYDKRRHKESIFRFYKAIMSHLGLFLNLRTVWQKSILLAFMLDHFAMRESGIVILQPSNSIVACSEVRTLLLSLPLPPINSEPVTGWWVRMLSLLPGFPTEDRLYYTETPARSCWLRSEDCSISK